MCAIFGFTHLQNEKLLHTFAASLTHRGPDENGFYTDNTCSLGMNRLAIVDIATGSQPYFSQKKDIVVVFNGEIYNHKELREELLKEQYSFHSDHSDGEIIANMYLHYGIDFVKKLNGMFAIALYDKRKKKLLLFRDRMGKKPLYYTFIENRLYFASEIKALKKLQYSFTLNRDALINYLQLKNISAPQTIYKEIHQLLPAHTLSYALETKKYTLKRYWQIDFSQKFTSSQESIQEELISLIEDATKIRTACDVEYGTFLSGGLDSSLISTIVAQKYNHNLKTFSLGYTEDFTNKQSDLFHARALAKKLGTTHYEYILDAQEVFQDIEKVLGAFDEPFSGTISTYFLTKLIAKHLKVTLSGDGADELFGSYLTHRVANPIEHFFTINKQEFHDLTEDEKKLMQPFNTQEGFHFIKEIAHKDTKKYKANFHVFSDEEINSLFKEPPSIIPNPYKSIILTSKSQLDASLEIDQQELLANQILPFIDRLSMSHSVEVRSPFLDYRVVEFAAKIPSSLKINNGINKYILKQAASKYLDDTIINRPKEGFVLPVYQWMENKFFHHITETILTSDMIGDLNFNENYIKTLISRFGVEKKQHAKIWNLYNLAVWYKGIKCK